LNSFNYCREDTQINLHTDNVPQIFYTSTFFSFWISTQCCSLIRLLARWPFQLICSNFMSSYRILFGFATRNCTRLLCIFFFWRHGYTRVLSKSFFLWWYKSKVALDFYSLIQSHFYTIRFYDCILFIDVQNNNNHTMIFHLPYLYLTI
jgi:hypothetical protein